MQLHKSPFPFFYICIREKNIHKLNGLIVMYAIVGVLYLMVQRLQKARNNNNKKKKALSSTKTKHMIALVRKRKQLEGTC